MQMTDQGSVPTHGPDVAVAARGVNDGQRTEMAIGAGGVPLTVSRPDGVVRGGVIVVQEAYGVNAHIAAVTRKLAGQGYLAVAPHLYHRAGDLTPDTFAAARPLLTGLTGDEMAGDLTAALEFLLGAGVDDDRIGIVGFCMGGTVALWAAATLPVAAAVTFYGAGITKPRWPGVPAGLESAASLRAPWLGLYGDADTSISTEEVEALRSTLGSSGVAAQIVRYPGAGHAFATDPASPHHVPEAAADAWNRALGWFDAHLR
jgi:carboxymethylenebutenolidase